MSATAGRLRVAVLMGGRSAERAVSLNTGEQVASALAVAGYDVLQIDTGEAGFINALQASGAEVAFICLHGRFGEDGTIQGLLELLDIPYVGSGVLASALAINKVASKCVLTAAGVPVPPSVAVRKGEAYDVDDIVAKVGEHTVVKPVAEGSTIGISFVEKRAELPAALEEAFRHDDLAMVERFVAGVEVTVGVIGNDDPIALPTIEIVPEHQYYDYESKYVPGMSRHIIPARFAEGLEDECRRLAVVSHIALGCRGMSRTDMIVTEDGAVLILETNTIPGMTMTSLLPDAARAAGIEFTELCSRLVELGVEEWERRVRL